MARPGPDPRGDGGADWRYVIDKPHRRKPLIDLPADRGEGLDQESGSTRRLTWHDQTLVWWDVVKTLPHAALWGAGDWGLAVATAYLADVAFRDGTTSAFTELRRREDELGMTVEARRKLRIKWVSAEEYAQLTGTASTPATKKATTTKSIPAPVVDINDRRRRSVAGA